MVDIVDIVFVNRMTKPFQSFPPNNASDFIWYSKLVSYINHFDMIYMRNTHDSPETIINQ